MLTGQSLCFNKAVKQGIQHGRLPIGDYIKMAARHVLTVNQVLEIMLRWLETREWEKAFMAIIPQRKLPEGQVDKVAASDAMGRGGEGNESRLDDTETKIEDFNELSEFEHDKSGHETGNDSLGREHVEQS